MLKYLIFCFFGTFILVSGFGPRKLYTINLPTTITSVKVTGRQIFFVGPWYISVVDNVQWKFNQKARMSPRIINKDIADPRNLGLVPTGTFKGHKKAHYWVTSYGLNDTGSGAVYIMQLTKDYSVINKLFFHKSTATTEWGDISVDSGWNYEHVQWVDMNRDGLKDCLTARFRGGIGQMLWFQQPPGQQLWNQKIIHEGMADGNFLGFIYDKKSYILIAGNQFNTLGLYWTMNRKNNWKYSRQIRFRVVDNYGKYYDVQYIDLNKDKRPDVLTTTVQISSSRGHVLGYEIPYDIQNANWRRRVLSAGFTGDYSPGKAIGYWPNKWKRKTDRPSIFLSGAGEERLFILSPKPKTTGWGYVKAALQAGHGMIGIPYIVDLNGDSFPEIFVPQANQIHVFSYDYSTSAKEPPKPKKTTSRKPTNKVKVPYRNPFFRPTPSQSPPAIPRGVSPVAPGLSAGLASRTPTYPELSANPQKPAAGAGSTLNSQPIYPVNSRYPNQGRILSNTQTGGRIPPVSGQRPLLPNPPNLQQGQQVLQPAGQAPILLNNGQVYMPYYPVNQQSRQSNQQNPLNPLANQQSPLNPLPNQQSPLYPLPNQQNPLSGAASGVVNSSQIPVAAEGPPQFFEPVTKDENQIPVIPKNFVLSVTTSNFSYRSEAGDACGFDKRVLCSLNQLLLAVAVGKEIPHFDWGWFDMEGRAARLKNCSTGEVKYDGYFCHNGIIEHLPVRKETSLPGLCCSVVNWASMTEKKYVRAIDAESECRNSSRHLCTLNEMMKVWQESSYKGYQWGWFRAQKQLLRMSHYCDPSQELWSGYQCVESKLELSETAGNIQEKGFCCPSAAPKTTFAFSTALLSAFITLLLIQKMIW